MAVQTNISTFGLCTERNVRLATSVDRGPWRQRPYKTRIVQNNQSKEWKSVRQQFETESFVNEMSLPDFLRQQYHTNAAIAAITSIVPIVPNTEASIAPVHSEAAVTQLIWQKKIKHTRRVILQAMLFSFQSLAKLRHEICEDVHKPCPPSKCMPK